MTKCPPRYCEARDLELRIKSRTAQAIFHERGEEERRDNIYVTPDATSIKLRSGDSDSRGVARTMQIPDGV